MGRFIITQAMVDKIKKIKAKGDLITVLEFNSPTFKSPSGNNSFTVKVAKAILGPTFSFVELKNGIGGVFTRVNPSFVDLKDSKLSKDLTIVSGKPDNTTFTGSDQKIFIPMAGKVIETSNPETTSKVQSIIFNRQFWTISKAKDWINNHPQFNIGKIDLPADGKTIRFRQQDPKKFKRFRILNIGDGNIKLVIGFKK